MNKLTEWLVKPLTEDINIPVNVGDTILVGRFKNKKMKVKEIGKDKHGMPTINGRKATTFRIHKRVNIFDKPDQVDECIAIAKKFGDEVVLGKNRDRNYNPNLKVVRELNGYGTEVCYVVDQDTDWSEGMNSYGIGIVNSALFVKRDEKDFDKAKKKKAMSKDGTRIREALQHKNIKDVVKSLLTYQDGIKGHTIISDGRKVVTIENTSRVKPAVKVHDISKEIIVRTNHGIQHPEQGYQRGPDKLSSQLRTKNALNILKKEKDYKKIFPLFYNHTQEKGAKFDLVRAQNKLWTSSQVMMNLNQREVTLYLIPGAVKFLGIENTLPNDYKSKIKLKVRQYEHGPSDKYDTYVTTDKKKEKSAIKDKDTSVKEEFGAGVIPSPSRKGINKNKTDKLSGYKKVEERFAVRGNKVEKFITGKNLTHKGRKYKEIEFETIKVDNPKKMVTLRILAPKNLFGQEVPVRFQTLRRGNIGKRLGVLFVEQKTRTVYEKDSDGNLVPSQEIYEIKEIISLATIRAALGTTFRITGLDSPSESSELALLLRAGALAAPMRFVEERTVGPSMGADNIEAGVFSMGLGMALVLLFILFYYRVFGVAASLALTFNVILLVAIMSILSATLTLPGIAGIVLTVGMAVDANVVIFSRVREGLKRGRKPLDAIDAGYNRAFLTIWDANITTLIVAVILLSYGSGPIKGFATTLSIGIITSMFTAIMGTRAFVNLIYGSKKNLQRLSI